MEEKEVMNFMWIIGQNNAGEDDFKIKIFDLEDYDDTIEFIRKRFIKRIDDVEG